MSPGKKRHGNSCSGQFNAEFLGQALVRMWKRLPQYYIHNHPDRLLSARTQRDLNSVASVTTTRKELNYAIIH